MILMNERRVASWSTDDVSSFLHANGMGRYAQLLSEEHDIDGEVLLLLTGVDFRLPPISIPVLAHIKRLINLVECLRERETNASPNRSHTEQELRTEEVNHISRQLNAFSFNDDTDDNKAVSKSTLEPEFFKTTVSFMYAVVVAHLTAFTMTVAHDRVPDMDRYPPLPDIFLDNVPRISWAFEACEACAVMLGMIFAIILLFHKHRMIILRRFFALTGTCFLLRCITMFVTSLSVPGAHLQCSGKAYGSLETKVTRTLEIMSGLGMSVTGVHTCGDYMFSGHTICLTMFNFFISEYTPGAMFHLHTASWILNLFGSFFILAAHEHYSIDVVIAFYISTRLFLYYHTLANVAQLGPACRRDRRTRVWFPMFSYLEAKVDSMVPNEFELPFARQLRYLYESWAGGSLNNNGNGAVHDCLLTN